MSMSITPGLMNLFRVTVYSCQAASYASLNLLLFFLVSPKITSVIFKQALNFFFTCSSPDPALFVGSQKQVGLRNVHTLPTIGDECMFFRMWLAIIS